MTAIIAWRKNKMDVSTIVLGASTTILFVAAVALIYACVNMLKKIENYEAQIKSADEQIKKYETWMEKFQGEVGAIYKRLKMVDEQNLFERDDDVGFVFSEILRVVAEFNTTINEEE